MADIQKMYLESNKNNNTQTSLGNMGSRRMESKITQAACRGDDGRVKKKKKE